MSNTVSKIIQLDGNRNAIVNIAAVLDTSNLNLVSYIKPLDFTNNQTRLTLTGFRLDSCEYAAGPSMGAQVYWNGDSPQLAASITNAFCLDWEDTGGLQPDQTRSGYDGSLNIVTTGYPPGTVQNLTLRLYLVKLYR